MNQEVTRLQELLARVQRNAALPRQASAVTAPIATTSLTTAEAAPVPAPRSRPIAEQPVPAKAPAPFVEQATFAAPEAPLNATLDTSVDELLLEDPFPLVSPAPAPSYGELFEDEPIPLVSVSSPRSAAHDDDVSGVVSVSEFSDDTDDLLDGDIVELTSSDSAEIPEGRDALDELNFDDSELDGEQRASIEEPPASSSRSRVAGTMDEALARAAAQIEIEEGREVPLQTPPPESGPQAAMPLPAGIQAPPAPDLDDLLEADIAPSGGVNAALPTAEQLGQTIELGEARGPVLELDHPAPFNPEPLQEELPNEELEVTLPGRVFVGGYQEDLMVPAEARQELDAHRQRLADEQSVGPPVSESRPSSPMPSPAAPPVAGFAAASATSSLSTDSSSESVSTVTVDGPANAEFAPELLARPDISPSPVAKFVRAQAPRPNTFLELLDASLALGRD